MDTGSVVDSGLKHMKWIIVRFDWTTDICFKTEIIFF
jgi:hypothetical protein